MQQEVIFLLASQFVDDLRVTLSTQSRRNQSLSFTTSKQSTTVSTWQNASTYVQCTNHVFFTAIDTWVASDDAATYHSFFQVVENSVDFFDSVLRLQPAASR